MPGMSLEHLVPEREESARKQNTTASMDGCVGGTAEPTEGAARDQSWSRFSNRTKSYWIMARSIK